MFQKVEDGKFGFPACWEDDVRMDALFAPFRPRDVNPENYDSKLKFWKDLIKKYLDFKYSADFSRTELANKFVRKGKVPYGLQTVLEDMASEKEIRLKSEFINDPLNTWKRWAVNTLVKAPVIWGLHFLSSGANEDCDPEYIHLEILQKHCESLEVFLHKYRGQVLSLEKLTELKGGNVNNEGLVLCLQYLHCLQKIYLHRNTPDKNVLIKVPNQNEAAKPLTEVDHAIYNLELLESKVLKTIQSLETELKQHEDSIKQYLREGKRSMAKSYLRKKHSVEARLEKKHTSLDNIHTLLSQVQEAQTHGEVLNAYKIGSKTLKTLISKPGMSADSVDEVFAQMKETLDIHDEIQQSMGTEINDSLDDTVLEKELNELLKPQEEKSKTKTEEDTSTVQVTFPKIKLLNDDDHEELLAQLQKLEVETELPSTTKTQMKDAKTSLT